MGHILCRAEGGGVCQIGAGLVYLARATPTPSGRRCGSFSLGLGLGRTYLSNI